MNYFLFIPIARRHFLKLLFRQTLFMVIFKFFIWFDSLNLSYEKKWFVFIEETSGDMMVPEGSSAKLICKARGFPKPKITWEIFLQPFYWILFYITWKQFIWKWLILYFFFSVMKIIKVAPWRRSRNHRSQRTTWKNKRSFYYLRHIKRNH